MLLARISLGILHSKANFFTRYLYEREHYNQAREFMQTALQALDERDTLMFASTSMLRGLIELDTNIVQVALDSFLTALSIREGILDPDDAFIASSLNAISLAYTELGNLEKAVETGQRAIDIRLRTASDRIGNSYSNMASTLLRMGKPDEAEEMLKRCPSLKDFTDETFLNTGNPRFSG
jgi:tetratricopeptide (TPR) repeat protein